MENRAVSQLAFSACFDRINRASSLAFMSTVSASSEGQARRGHVHGARVRLLNRSIFGLAVPPVKILFRGFYGPRWAQELSRLHGRHLQDVYSCVNGSRGLPRSFFSDALEEYRDPAKRAAWEKAQRAELERELARRIERRAACARWFELLLSGGAQLPAVNRWRAWKSGRVENFLGKADL